MNQVLQFFLEFVKQRYHHLLLAFIISISYFPSLIIYFNDQTSNYTMYGIPKLMILLMILFLMITLSYNISQKNPVRQILLSGLFLFFNLWFYFVGFYELSLLFGMSTLVIWSMVSQSNIDYKKALSLLFLLLIIFFPLISKLFIQTFQSISMYFIDHLLNLSDVSYQRNGTFYLIKGFQVEIWEGCSGYSFSRNYLILLLFIHHLRKKYQYILPSIIVAIVLGLFTNIIRIYLHILGSNYQGTPLHEWMHDVIGLSIFSVITLIIVYQSFKDRKPLDLIDRSNNQRLSISSTSIILLSTIILIATMFQLSIFPDRINKKITHQYVKSLNTQLKTVHHNTFNEWAGGGLWILFEHPIQYCYKYYGWKEGSQRDQYIKQNKKVTINTVYTIDQRKFTSRFQAILYKIYRIDLYNKPIHVEITITSPFWDIFNKSF